MKVALVYGLFGICLQLTSGKDSNFLTFCRSKGTGFKHVSIFIGTASACNMQSLDWINILYSLRKLLYAPFVYTQFAKNLYAGCIFYLVRINNMGCNRHVTLLCPTSIFSFSFHRSTLLPFFKPKRNKAKRKLNLRVCPVYGLQRFLKQGFNACRNIRQ
jgi:hypothetical protein